MKVKLKKILNKLKGTDLMFGVYGLKYKFYNTSDNLARLKYGKEKYLEKKIGKTIFKYKHYEKYKNLRINQAKKHLEKFPIWFCWFQGLSDSPEIVKICYESIKKNISPESELILITQENLSNYIEIPNVINEKLKSGKISYTLFSDFVRIALLSKYGGFWIDSTILVTNDISNLCNYNYYTKKSDRIEPNFGNYLLQGRFAIHLLKIDNDKLLINFLYDALIDYYKKNDQPVDYFMTNLLVDIAYNNFKEVKEMMDNLEYNDQGLESRLCEKLNNNFDK